MMHEGYTQVTPKSDNRITRGSHPGCARVRPIYVRACTRPCPAVSSQLTRLAPSRTRRIPCTVGLRSRAGSAPTSRQGRNQVARGWKAGYALATPWSRPDNQATLEQHPVHHGANPGHAAIKHKLRPEYTGPLPGNAWETPGAHPSYTRKPGGSAGTGVVPRGTTSGDTPGDTPGTPK